MFEEKSTGAARRGRVGLSEATTSAAAMAQGGMTANLVAVGLATTRAQRQRENTRTRSDARPERRLDITQARPAWLVGGSELIDVLPRRGAGSFICFVACRHGTSSSKVLNLDTPKL